MIRVRVDGAGHYPIDGGLNNRLGARGRAPLSRTRLQGYIERRAFWTESSFPGIEERLDFGVGCSCSMMPAAPNDSAALHQDRADHGVGGSRAITTAGQA